MLLRGISSRCKWKCQVWSTTTTRGYGTSNLLRLQVTGTSGRRASGSISLALTSANDICSANLRSYSTSGRVYNADNSKSTSDAASSPLTSSTTLKSARNPPAAPHAARPGDARALQQRWKEVMLALRPLVMKQGREKTAPAAGSFGQAAVTSTLLQMREIVDAAATLPVDHGVPLIIDVGRALLSLQVVGDASPDEKMASYLPSSLFSDSTAREASRSIGRAFVHSCHLASTSSHSSGMVLQSSVDRSSGSGSGSAVGEFLWSDAVAMVNLLRRVITVTGQGAETTAGTEVASRVGGPLPTSVYEDAIDACAAHGKWRSAMGVLEMLHADSKTYKQLKDSATAPDAASPPAPILTERALSSAIRAAGMQTGQSTASLMHKLYQTMLSEGIPRSAAVYVALFRAFSRERLPSAVESLWQKLRTVDAAVYEAMCAGTAQGGGQGMESAAAASASASVADKEYREIALDAVVSARVEMHCREHKYTAALALLQEAEGDLAKYSPQILSEPISDSPQQPLPVSPLAHSYTSLLRGYLESNQLEAAEALLSAMHHRRIRVSQRQINASVRSMTQTQGQDQGAAVAQAYRYLVALEALPDVTLATDMAAAPAGPVAAASDSLSFPHLSRLRKSLRVEHATLLQLFDSLLMAVQPRTIQELQVHLKPKDPCASDATSPLGGVSSEPSWFIAAAENVFLKAQQQYPHLVGSVAAGGGRHSTGSGGNSSSAPFPWLGKLVSAASRCNYLDSRRSSEHLNAIEGGEVYVDHPLDAISNIIQRHEQTLAGSTLTTTESISIFRSLVSVASRLKHGTVNASVAAAVGAATGGAGKEARFGVTSDSPGSMQPVAYACEVKRAPAPAASTGSVSYIASVYQDPLDAALQFHMKLLSSGSNPEGSAPAATTSNQTPPMQYAYTPDVTTACLAELAGQDHWDGVKCLIQQALHSPACSQIWTKQAPDNGDAEGLAEGVGPEHPAAPAAPPMTFPQMLFEKAVKTSLYTSKGNGGVAAALVAYQLDELRHICESYQDDGQRTDRGVSGEELNADRETLRQRYRDHQHHVNRMLFPTYRSVRYVLRSMEAECDWAGILSFFSSVLLQSSSVTALPSTDAGPAVQDATNDQDKEQRQLPAVLNTGMFAVYSPPEIECLYVFMIKVCGILEEAAAMEKLEAANGVEAADEMGEFDEVASGGEGDEVEDEGAERDGNLSSSGPHAAYYPLAIEYLSDYLAYYNANFEGVIQPYNKQDALLSPNATAAGGSAGNSGGVNKGASTAGTSGSGDQKAHHQTLPWTNGRAVFLELINVLIKHEHTAAMALEAVQLMKMHKFPLTPPSMKTLHHISSKLSQVQAARRSHRRMQAEAEGKQAAERAAARAASAASKRGKVRAKEAAGEE